MRTLPALPILLALPARAELPMPTFPDCGAEPDRPDLCPDDLHESWEHVSYVRDEWLANVDPVEWDLGTGIWADRAWRWQTGRTDVVIAVLDSGELWDEADTLGKHALNTAELPLPQDAGGVEFPDYDANGDGLVNVFDWEEDPRVDWSSGLDPNMAGAMDTSDLIQSFSDGVDDDDNGYVDDIAGWDFFWNDNDPYDDTRYDHGAFEGRLSVAEGNDGVGWIGTCPNCMLMNLRVGDSFVADGANFAAAATYAVDNGARVIQEALGTINHPSFAREAIDYAWDNGVLVVASAADEDSYHPNAPGFAHHTLYVHSIVPDDDEDEATSFLAYANGSNHGARLVLSVSSPYASSGATGLGAGVAGLVVSEALDQGIVLSADELYQVLVASADDIALQPDDDAAAAEGRYPSKAGWDRYFGYGRLNAEAAVLRVREGAIPPEADISSPMWFETLDPERRATVTVEGIARASRSSGLSWTLAYGLGDQPDDYTTIASGTDAVDGVLAEWDLSTVPLDAGANLPTYPLGWDQVDREDAVNQFTVTLRLQVTDAEGNTGELRKAVYLRTDPDLLDAFPLWLGGSLESSPNLVDLDGDGARDIVVGDADGNVHALRSDGTELPGWPVQVEWLEEHDPDATANHLAAPALASGSVGPARASVTGSVAVGDLDGDGVREVVAGSLRGSLFAWHADGSLLSGFPVAQERVDPRSTDAQHLLDEGFFSSPALGDLDGDGDLEIVVGGMDQRVYAWHHDGTAVEGWPVQPAWGTYDYQSRIVSSPAIGDLDEDGHDDVVIGTNETLNGTYGPVYAISGLGEADPRGALLPGWPVAVFGAYTQALPYVGEGLPSSPALGDLDGDGHLEVAAHTIAGDVVVFDHDGAEVYACKVSADHYGEGSNANDASAFPFINNTAIGDLDGDGTPDLVSGAIGSGFATAQLFEGKRAPLDFMVSAWSGRDGIFLEGWPRVIEDMQFFVNPAIADLDGDGSPEAVAGSGGFVLHAWNAAGEEPQGWPKFTGEWIMASAAVGDIDGDDLLEVVVGTRGGWLYAWNTTSPASARVAWQSFGHDPANTANHEAPLEGFNPPVPGATTEPGGCCKKDGKSDAFLLLPLAGLGAWRRRRALARRPAPE